MADPSITSVPQRNQDLLGLEVSTDDAGDPYSAPLIEGNLVTLEQNSREHVSSLWRNLGLPENSFVFDWIPSAPPETESDFLDLFKEEKYYFIKANPKALNLYPQEVVSGIPSNKPHTHVLGVIGFSGIKRDHRELEVGALFAPMLQQTYAATEAHYLILQRVLESHAFPETLPYRRVVWKCNSLNQQSRRAAVRLGYVFEGKFRNHMIVKGRSRDSEWFSIIDDDWPGIKSALETWLNPDNFDGNGLQKMRLQDVRRKL